NRTIHTVTITGDEAVTMCSYPGALSQVITNLVMNSLEHAFSDDVPGQIEIAVEGDADSVVIHYADDGRGMREQVRARIFEPFFTTARGQGGTGLGMHLVYNLVTQKLDGSIQCSSSPGTGTTFVLTLPSSLQTLTP
ncbi:MAG: HAMP domain-containing histidine kinase, partial [Caldilineaceae bacterium]|nr:HAMP domain-containing histidine kinase [Caldilineaceae bacterium]